MLSEGVKGDIYYIDLRCVWTQTACSCPIGKYGIRCLQIDFHLVIEYSRTRNQTRTTVLHFA